MARLRLLFRAAFYAAFVTISCLAVIPDYNGLPPIVTLSDLLNHAAAFFVLYLLLRGAHPSLNRQKSTLLLIAYAIMIEVVQAFLPTRDASLGDIGADMAGILLAHLFLMYLFLPTLRKFRSA